MDLIQYLLVGFLIGCLFTVIGVEIGRAIKKRKLKTKSFFEMEFKVRPMPKCKPTKDDVFETLKRAQTDIWDVYLKGEWGKDCSEKQAKEMLAFIYKAKKHEKEKTDHISPGAIAEMAIEAIDKATKELHDRKVPEKLDLISPERINKFLNNKALRTNCPHCKFLDTLFSDIKHRSYREYWIYTEVFVYLHGGKDYCNWKEI